MSLYGNVDLKNYPYQPGKLYLGRSFDEADERIDVGINLERNALTIAGSRVGKGTCLIIPNLLRWEHNTLTIDPKGEAAEASLKARKKMGQKVNILDPFNFANIGNHPRAKINVLDQIDPNDPNAFRFINALADGLVMKHDPKGGHWDGGGRQVLAGFMAHVLSHPDYEGRRNLLTVRELLTQTGDEFSAVVDAMAQNHACGRLASSGAAKLLNTGNEAGHFLSVATSNTEWLADPHMQDCLSESTFKFSDLKNRNADVFLVLPLDAIREYGQFLRLFVRVAIFAMQQRTEQGALKGKRCLFILDEFFSLGHIAEIEESAGALPGLGVHLWPFLQDSSQLIQRYEKGAETFYANATVQTFTGVIDQPTLGMLSHMYGMNYGGGLYSSSEGTRPNHTNGEIEAYISKDEEAGDLVAKRLLCKLSGDRWLTLAMAPYFNETYWDNLYLSSHYTPKRTRNRAQWRDRLGFDWDIHRGIGWPLMITLGLVGWFLSGWLALGGLALYLGARWHYRESRDAVA